MQQEESFMQHKWWHDKIFYQIYPKSFYDSNGDGIGDLRGIIQKLDYLKYLGADVLWLSPIYQSPLADQGYDISDYYAIDPRFGTMEDMEELIAEAKKRGMYILMDLVVNHCSDEHAWFEEAKKDPDGPYGKFFYLEDLKNGRPCNWRSCFGGSVWEPLPGTDKQYLHIFHKKQPDLNWENPEVRKEIYRNINWWLEKGLGGFRIDAIINIKKPLPFQDYEPDRADGLCSVSEMLSHARGIGSFLNEMKHETFDKYDAFTVGEVFDMKEDELGDFIGPDGYFSSIFDFNEAIFGESPNGWYDAVKITGEDYKNCCFEAQKRASDTGFLSNIIENHDEPRGVSRYLPDGEHSDKAKKMLGGLNFLLRGLPFLYQGQEIGMENTTFTSIQEIDDISSLDQYQVALDAGQTPEQAFHSVCAFSRDNARTPVQWDSSSQAGFTSGTPWLNVNPNYQTINVAAQEKDDNSVLSFYKKLIALRKNPLYKDTLVYGSLIPYRREQKNLMAYFRKNSGQTLLIIGNFQDAPQTLTLDAPFTRVLMNNCEEFRSENSAIFLEGYQFLVLEMKP